MESDTTTWQEGIELKQRYPSLDHNLEVDVLVIGAGITGATTAYLLSKTNLKVALIESSILGKNSATAYTTAMISYETDTDLSTLVETFDTRRAKLAWEAGRDAIRFIERTVKNEKIDCEFVRVDGFSFTKNQKDLDDMEDEIELCDSFGFDVSMGEKSLGFETAGYEVFPDQAKLHPLKYIMNLIQKASENGCLVFENTEAIKVIEREAEVIVETKSATVLAKDIVMATYSPFTHPLSMYFKAGKYTTYVIEAEIKKGLIKEGIYEDWESPYHYFRIDPGEKADRIIIGGEDHRSDLPVSAEKSFRALENYLKKLVRSAKFIRRWTGPILEPVDGLPYAGKLGAKSHQYITHGFSGTGMTFGTVSALLFSDMIQGNKNKYEKLLDPARLPTIAQLIAKGRDYGEELVGAQLKILFLDELA